MALLTRPAETGQLAVQNPQMLPERFGLANLGATCWFNALVQGLISCTSFCQWVTRGAKAPPGSLLGEMHTLLRGATRGAVAVPHGLIGAFRAALAHKGFHAGGNESACEGLSLLLELLDDREETLAEQFQHHIDEWVVCGGCGKTNGTVSTKAIHFEFFGVNPTTADEFSDLLVNGAPSPVDADYRCEHCPNGVAEKKGGVRHHRLTRVYEVLIVLFNRYGAALGENPRPYYPQEVGIPCRLGVAVYRAVASVEHSGGLTGGHYWARGVRREPGGTALCLLNDGTSQVEAAGDAVPPSPAVYFVIYHFAGLKSTSA